MQNIEEVIKKLVKFRDDRDWKQFHDTKNLALALSIEAAELNELFLWKNKEEAVNQERLEEELADILAYAFLIAEKNQLNIEDIIDKKIAKNALKYPIEKAKGSNLKYKDL